MRIAVQRGGNPVPAETTIVLSDISVKELSSGLITAPDNTNTADKIIATSGGSATRAVYQNFVGATGVLYTTSVYVKASEYSLFAIQEIGGGRFGASFDLTAQTTASLGGVAFVSSSITSEGNGWFRCSVVWAGSLNSHAITFIGYPTGASLSAAGASYAGDGVSGVRVWGGQTEAVPDYKCVTGSELVTNGGFTSNSNWTLGTNWSISGGQLIASSVSGFLDASQNLSLTDGKLYRIAFEVTVTSGSVSVILGTSGSASAVTLTVTTSGTYVLFGPHITGQAKGIRFRSEPTFTGTIDNVSVREVTSINQNPAPYQRVTTVAETNVAPLTIGNSFAADAPFAGSIALLKLGATVPTPEQSVFMYEQEKQLFRSGAQSVMPDSGAIIDMSYDDATDRWVSVSATNESYWTGLVRNSVTPVPAGSYTKIAATSGIELAARSTVNAGVDVTIPAYNMREELLRRSETATKLNAQLATLDYVGGFTASTTVGNTAITTVAGITYPTAYIGARVTGTGIPANTTIAAVSGTTIYLSSAATVTATGVAISFQDFILPVGLEAKEVSLAGVAQREGSTAQFTRLFDGFKETIRFGTAPSNTALIQIQAVRAAS
jgi:hypothetical protein